MSIIKGYLCLKEVSLSAKLQALILANHEPDLEILILNFLEQGFEPIDHKLLIYDPFADLQRPEPHGRQDDVGGHPEPGAEPEGPQRRDLLHPRRWSALG